MAVVIEAGTLLALRPKLDLATAEVMIQGAIWRAAQVAPCILADDFAKADVAAAIILDALVRRADTGGGGLVTQQTAGPFSQSTDTRSVVNLFTTQERADLINLCGRRKGAHTVPTAPAMTDQDSWMGARINGPLGQGPEGR